MAGGCAPMCTFSEGEGELKAIDVDAQPVGWTYDSVPSRPADQVSLIPQEVMDKPDSVLPGSSQASSPWEMPDTGDGHTAIAQVFHEDLENWIGEVSEVFHYRVFVIELVGQLLYTVLGPLSIPILLLMYGGRIGLINRGFWPARHPSFVLQLILWACLFASLVLSMFADAPNVMLIEKKFAIICLLMRNAPIATKYAYCSTETWTKFNTEIISDEYKAFQNMLSGWYVIPEANLGSC